MSLSLKSLLKRGPSHRDRLESIDRKIVVSGTRGKSTLTKWIYETFHSRGYDVTGKITGNKPVTIHSGDVKPIERDGRVTLYENVEEVKKHKPSDVLVMENQAITPYTTRLVNQEFGDADIVVLSNIREDHLSTLGKNLADITQSFAQSIPSGTHVVNAERDPHIRSFLESELDRIGSSISHVTVPRSEDHIPGIESVYALNHVLTAAGEDPVPQDKLDAYREKMAVTWTELPDGLVYNAAEVNDVQSTELIRRSLTRDTETPIQPFLYLRGDRRGRTVSFLRYLSDRYEEDAFDTVHVAGDDVNVFKRKADFPVEVHTEKDAGTVLDQLLEDELPVYIMGNTVSQFMRDLDDEIERRCISE